MLTALISLLIPSQNPVAPAASEAVTKGADATTAAGQQSSWSGLIMIVLLIAVFYFFMIRPQQKKAKQLRKEREAMKEGDYVVTAGGIHGKIVGVRDNVFVISIGDNVRIKVEKTSVYPSAADIEQTSK